MSTVGPMDEEKSALLLAHFASLLDGVTAGHVDRHAFLFLADSLQHELTTLGLLNGAGRSTGVPLRAEVLWNAFVSAVGDTATAPHPTTGKPFAFADTRLPDPDYCDHNFITISQLEYQVKAVQTGAAALGKTHLEHVSRHDIARQAGRRAKLTEIVDCVTMALSLGSPMLSDFLKGSAERIVWITPIESRVEVPGRVEALLDMVDLYGVSQIALDELRNLLGLWMEDGANDRPLAVFYVKCTPGLSAPNVITASAYPRFRHRPVGRQKEAPNAGLTFNLDRALAATYPGACEVVGSGIPLGQVVAVRLCGQPSPFGFIDADEELKAHQEYSRDVSDGRSWQSILLALEALEALP